MERSASRGSYVSDTSGDFALEPLDLDLDPLSVSQELAGIDWDGDGLPSSPLPMPEVEGEGDAGEVGSEGDAGELGDTGEEAGVGEQGGATEEGGAAEEAREEAREEGRDAHHAETQGAASSGPARDSRAVAPPAEAPARDGERGEDVGAAPWGDAADTRRAGAAVERAGSGVRDMAEDSVEAGTAHCAQLGSSGREGRGALRDSSGHGASGGGASGDSGSAAVFGDSGLRQVAAFGAVRVATAARGAEGSAATAWVPKPPRITDAEGRAVASFWRFLSALPVRPGHTTRARA